MESVGERSPARVSPPEAGFDELYRAHYGDLVAAVFGLIGDVGEAQEVVQEAFCRAWQRWDAVVAYDNPAAWVRRVAFNVAVSRWRRVRLRLRYLRGERAGVVAPLDADHVAIVRALRTLPDAQCRAVVLFHLMDLPLEQVAVELGAPVGTVKSWLSRGRVALAAQLQESGVLGEGGGRR